MLSTFALLAEIERDLISERTKAALSAAKAKGIRLGRKPGVSKIDPYEAEIRHQYRMGVKQTKIAERFGCSDVTLSKWLKQKKKKWM